MNKEVTIDIDLISRQAVLASIKNLYPDMPIVDIFGARREWLEKYAPYFECENAIEQLPPVSPQKPSTGYWIKHNNAGVITIQCPVCRKEYLRCLINYFNYCPFCGEHLLEKDTKGIYRKKGNENK